ncbi:uncharacterized protein LOC132716730 [Ruditapes philippinarum]|uniref:uncharacterized protein LOC132716730 n=1 Tax=Ruditapes philippinarum TaxID=129788 RepID=UPI00295B0319|nr:uncharacterized protein LOC132716730 [Ruditapes philippinarum]
MLLYLQLINSADIDLKKYEMDKRSPDTVNFYFNELYTSMRVCFEFGIVLEVDVVEHKPSAVKVFDYYETELETTIFYDMTKCSEANIEYVDVSINGDTDLYLEGDSKLNIEDDSKLNIDADSHLPTDTLSHPGGNEQGNAAAPSSETTDIEDGVAAPPTGPQCPKCVTTGVVNILQDICKKQVWLLERKEQMSLRVMTADGVSPDITIDIPESLENCGQCSNLFEKGDKSLIFLEPYDWSNLGANIAQKSTMIIPWSASLNESILQVLASCSYL